MTDALRHVVIATPLSAPDIGGPATYARLLEAELPPRGIDITVVSFRDVRHLLKGWRHLVYCWRLVRASRKADAVFALDGVSVGVPARIAAWWCKKPLLLRVPGDYAWEQGQQRFGLTDSLDAYAARGGSRAPLPVRCLRWLQTGTAKRAVRIVVPSDYMKGIVASWGIAEEKIITIYSTLSPLAVEDTYKEARQRLGYGGFVVASAGRLVPWKGMDALMTAVVSLRSSIPDISLIIAGEGPEREKLVTLVREQYAEEYVTLTGALESSELGAVIKAADVFVLNTGYEGLSHQLLEVMDLGTPIVTTPVGGNPELIEHEHTGMLVPYDDEQALAAAIADLYTNPEKRTRLAQAAKQRTCHFTKEAVLEKLLQVFRSLV